MRDVDDVKTAEGAVIGGRLYKTPADFYQSRVWQHKRKAILRRDGYQCQGCKRCGKITKATQVHHIKHLDEYPELRLDDENLVSLCLACHNHEHPEKRKPFRGQYSHYNLKGNAYEYVDEI